MTLTAGHRAALAAMMAAREEVTARRLTALLAQYQGGQSHADKDA